MDAESSKVAEVFGILGWNFEEYSNLVAQAPFDTITPLNSHLSGFGGLHVSEWMRFGNSVVQLSNLAQLCLKFSIPAVYYQDEHPFFNVSKLQGSIGVPFLRRGPDELAAQDAIVLSGRFFFDSPYGLFVDQERQGILDTHIAPLLPRDFVEGSPLVDEEVLTVHIRSGDIFHDDIHPTMGQPPLSYYELVLEQAKKTRIVVVTEDLRNPVIAPFMGLARSKDLEVVMFSGGLRQSLRLLFNSYELVGGIGSFAWAVESLSRKIRRYWFFERVFDESLFARSQVRAVRVSDTTDQYVAAVCDDWRNTLQQRQMMLEFPISALESEEG